MDNWEEVKTAYTVGTLGTVTKAAKALNIHRATVIRHIDSLESRLGHKLFFRHTNGYRPTDAGKDLISVVKITDEQFSGLSQRIKGQSEAVSGELIITSLEALAPLIMPHIKIYRERHPETQIVFIGCEKVLKLEYGEAHIALRPGKKPDLDDNVVIPFDTLEFGLYATQDYIAKHGAPERLEDLENHSFVGRYDTPRTHFEQWMNDTIPAEQIKFKITTPFLAHQGILNHLGIGFLPSFIEKEHENLVPVLPKTKKWPIPLWLIVHKDIYRLEKVQAFLDIVKSHKRYKVTK